MENCKKSDLIVNIRTKGPARFKAGSDLSSKVNLVDVDLNEELTETAEIVELKIRLSSESCGSADMVEA